LAVKKKALSPLEYFDFSYLRDNAEQCFSRAGLDRPDYNSQRYSYRLPNNIDKGAWRLHLQTFQKKQRQQSPGYQINSGFGNKAAREQYSGKYLTNKTGSSPQAPL